MPNTPPRLPEPTCTQCGALASRNPHNDYKFYATCDHGIEVYEWDNCQFCLGMKGGVKGNENRIYKRDGGYYLCCDCCSVILHQILT